MTLSVPQSWRQATCPFLVLLWLLAPQAASAQPTAPTPTPEISSAALLPTSTEPRLRVTLPWGIVVTYPVARVTGTPCLTVSTAADLLSDIDETATLHWDPSNAVCRIDFSGHEIFLYGNQNVMVFNGAVVPTDAPLIVLDNSPHVPLSVLEQILRTVPEVGTNIADFESTPTPQPPPPTSASRLGVPPQPLPESVMRALAQSLPQLADTSTALTDGLRPAAEALLRRQTIVIDPQPNGGALPGADVDPPDVTLDIARRCREIIERSKAARVVLTRDLGGDPSASVDERLRIANTADASALVCLRIDWSAFPENRGFHRYAMHEAVVVEAPAAAGTDAIPLVESAYLRYQNVALLLGEILESRVLDVGHVAAEPSLRLLPAYMLKRAAMPSATLVLGYWSNPADRAFMETPDYVETIAQALAAALIDYLGWLAQMELEAAQ